MTETTTLDKIETGDEWTAEEMHKRNTLLLLASHLATLQANIADEIEQMYKAKGVYQFSIKHNHKKIIQLLKENTTSVFFKRMNQEQVLVYGDDAEELERVVYAWAGLEKPDEEYMEINGLDLNVVAKKSYGDAERRDQIDKYASSLMQINKIKEEWGELFRASNNASIHIPYTEQQEEAADVIIATLTLLHGQGIDINKLIGAKVDYNANRRD